MVLAILLGAVAGVFGFLPLVIGLRSTKRTPSTSVFGPMAKLLLALGSSFLLVFVLTVFFIAWDKPHGMPFVLTEVIVLCGVAIGYGVRKNLVDAEKR